MMDITTSLAPSFSLPTAGIKANNPPTTAPIKIRTKLNNTLGKLR